MEEAKVKPLFESNCKVLECMNLSPLRDMKLPSRPLSRSSQGTPKEKTERSVLRAMKRLGYQLTPLDTLSSEGYYYRRGYTKHPYYRQVRRFTAEDDGLQLVGKKGKIEVSPTIAKFPKTNAFREKVLDLLKKNPGMTLIDANTIISKFQTYERLREAGVSEDKLPKLDFPRAFKNTGYTSKFEYSVTNKAPVKIKRNNMRLNKSVLNSLSSDVLDQLYNYDKTNRLVVEELSSQVGEVEGEGEGGEGGEVESKVSGMSQ
jgi:hypothetical protein